MQRHVDVDTRLAWTRGQLTFQLRPFADVARELERWYDLEVTLEDSSLATVPVKASFTNQPTDEVLAIIAQSLDIRYRREGSHVWFYTGHRSR